MGDKDEGEFPEVQGGGSLILAWQIKGKKVLVIGGGEVSTESKPTPRHPPTHLPRPFTPLIHPRSQQAVS